MERHGGNLDVFIKWKKPVWEYYILYDSNYDILEKPNYTDSKKFSGCQGLREQEGLIEHIGFSGQWKYSLTL